MRATGSRVKKKKVIRNNTVGPLLVIYLCFRKGVRGTKETSVFCSITDRELEPGVVAKHHGSVSPPIEASSIHS